MGEPSFRQCSLAIDAGPLDCFVIGDGEVIRRKQKLSTGPAGERFPASRTNQTGGQDDETVDAEATRVAGLSARGDVSFIVPQIAS